MGGCVTTEEKKRSQEIDKILNGDRKRLREEVKLLLLGIFQIPSIGYYAHRVSISYIFFTYFR